MTPHRPNREHEGAGPILNLNSLLIVLCILSTIMGSFGTVVTVAVVVVWRGATIEAVIENVRQSQIELTREQRLQGIDIGTLKTDVAVLKGSTERDRELPRGRSR